MRGIVWYKNKDVGFEKMRRIMQGYEMRGIGIQDTNLVQSREHISVQFTNGDIWKCIPVRESARGNRTNISIIERCIDKEMVENVIFPATTSYPYKAFDFYGEGELGWR